MDDTRWIVVVALLAMTATAVVFVESYSSSQATYSARPRLLISLWNNQTDKFRGVVIANNIGDPGGIITSTRFLQDGINGYYPLTTRDFSGTIHVDSRIHRDYTLGDFFEVWGEPLGPFDTLGYHANITSSSNQFFWSMCLNDPHTPSNIVYSVNQWGSHVLRDNETIILTFALESCALATSTGG